MVLVFCGGEVLEKDLEEASEGEKREKLIKFMLD
jgi:hypothetical protein